MKPNRVSGGEEEGEIRKSAKKVHTNSGKISEIYDGVVRRTMQDKAGSEIDGWEGKDNLCTRHFQGGVKGPGGSHGHYPFVGCTLELTRKNDERG